MCLRCILEADDLTVALASDSEVHVLSSLKMRGYFLFLIS